MYNIKQIPEDFIVKEVLQLNKKKIGKYGYFKIKKKDWNTLSVVREISKRLKLKARDVGYAGLKDRRAVTEQFISIKGGKRINFKIKDVEIKKIGEGDDPIRLGGLKENSFKIVVRNLDEKRRLRVGKIVNYFDKQRFSDKNLDIGRSLLKRDYKELCRLLGLKNKESVFNFDRRILKFALSSFQSYVFNKAVKKCLENNKFKLTTLPIISFDTKFKNKSVEKIYKKIMDEGVITREDFIFREMPFLISEGTERKIFVKPSEFKYSYGHDELNKSKIKCTLRFKLPKGSYGTLVVKKLFDK